MLNSPPPEGPLREPVQPSVVLGPPPGGRLNRQPRRSGPPPTWAQHFAARRAARGTVIPVTWWGYPLMLVAGWVILGTSLIDLPAESSLRPIQPKLLWSHPAFAFGFWLMVLSVVLAVAAGRSKRPRSVSLGVHAALVLAVSSACYVVGFIDVARRVALLSDADIGIGGGVIAIGVLGICGLSLAVSDGLQLPDLRRLEPLKYVAGYAWAPVLIGAVMLFRDVRVGKSYAARAGALTDPVTGAPAEGAVRAGQLGYASSGLGYLLVVLALVLLLAAAAVTWVRRPRRFAHVPASLVAGPLIVAASVLVVLEVLRVLVATARPAAQIATRIDVAASDVHLNLGYGGWMLLLFAAGLLLLGTYVTQAGLASPRIAPYRPTARRVPPPTRIPPPAPMRSAPPMRPPTVRPPPFEPSTKQPMPRPARPAADLDLPVAGNGLPEAAIAVGSTPIGATVLGAAALSVPAPDLSSATGQYAAFPTPVTRRPTDPTN